MEKLDNKNRMNAQFTVRDSAFCACLIQDFNRSGLTISYNATHLADCGITPAQISSGEQVSIFFNIASENHALKGRFGEVVSQQRFEVQFVGASHKAYLKMLHRAEEVGLISAQEMNRILKSDVGNQYQKPPVEDSKRERITEQLHEMFAEFVNTKFPLFLKTSIESITSTAEREADKLAQTLQENSILIERNQQPMFEMYCNLVAEQFDASFVQKLSRDEREDDGSDNIALVDKEDFEDWLIVKVMISNADDENRQELMELQHRLDYLFGTQLGRYINPMRPESLCAAIRDTLIKLTLHKRSLKLVYQAFKQEVVESFSAFYTSLNEYLVSEDILSSTEVAQYLKRSRPAAGSDTTVENKAADSDASAVDNGGGRQSTGFPQGAVAPVTAPQIGNPETTGEIATDQHHPTDENQQVQDEAGTVGEAVESGEVGGIAGQIVGLPVRSKIPRFISSTIADTERLVAKKAAKVAQSLLKIQTIISGGADEPEEPVVENPENTYTHAQVMKALLILQKRFDKIVPKVLHGTYELRPLVVKVLDHKREKKLRVGEAERGSLEVIDRLFLSIVTNGQLAEGIKPILGKLKIPVAHVYLEDESLLKEDEHPVRKVLNHISQLGMQGGVYNQQNESVIADIVNVIMEHFTGDLELFEQAIPRLEELVHRQEQVFQRNVDRLTDSYSGKEKIELGREEVRRTVRQAVVGGKAPKPLISLLSAGWRELLMKSYLRQGPESKPWEMASLMVEQLVAHLSVDENGPVDVQHDPETFLQIIEKGLAKVNGNEQAVKEALEEIKGALNNPRKEEIERVGIDVLDDLFKTSGSRKAEDDLTVDDITPSERWLEKVTQLQTDNWIIFMEEGREVSRARLAWIAQNYNQFVFVNKQCLKVREMTKEGLAWELQEGNVQVAEMEAPSIVDQSLDSVVENIYSQLSYETSHDQLTGLINRKEFERLIHRALVSAKERCREHLLLYLDLDQFKVINNNCGNEAGDEVLREISELLSGNLTKEGTVSRLGGNAFGVLVEDCSVDEGYRVADNLVAKIREYRFEWDDTPFSLSVSVGLIVINEEADEVNNLFKYVEAACVDAKESGRNRIKIYKIDDEEMIRRQSIMNWVAKLHRALDQDQLQLRAQPIHTIEPLSDSDGGWLRKKDDNADPISHYEILMSVIDEEGKPIPPLDFISAAERYNRMQTVDRWIIKNSFDWMLRNKAYIDRINGISINLSGHSMNDLELLNYVFEELKRTGLPASIFCFEVTETSAVTHINDAADFIREMKQIGCKFSLDDFGAGLSSYTYLKNLPVDFIKIDGAFVKNLDTDATDFAMVKSITEMGHLMEKKVVAEFVRNKEILEKLREIGVDYAQGFHVGKPVILDELDLSQLPPLKVVK